MASNDTPWNGKVNVPSQDYPHVTYESFSSPSQLEHIVALIENDLSEPYSIYTYRCFIYQWPDLCKLAFVNGRLVGVIICKVIDLSRERKGYIAMLAVSEAYRNMGIGRRLVELSLLRMKELNVTKVSLETDENNYKALSLYGKFGFYRENYLPCYYFNGASAFVLELNIL